MNILVTGAAGFIGFSLSKKLLEDGNRVTGVDNINDFYDVNLKKARLNILKKFKDFSFYKKDICNQAAIDDIYYKNNISVIVNLAAQCNPLHSLKDPFAFQKSNIEGFLTLLEVARKYKPRNFLYASTSSVYGDNKNIPFEVEYRTDSPISLYAATKKANELMAYTYSHTFDIPCTGFRFFTVYGPWGRPDMALFKFTKAILNNEPIDVYNSGNHRRDFTYIDDIVSGIIAAINRPSKYEIYNIGNSKMEELMDYIGLLEKHLGRKAKKNFLPMQPGDMKETFSDISKTKKDLGFKPKTSIDEGIKNFVEWYKKYYDLKWSIT